MERFSDTSGLLPRERKFISAYIKTMNAGLAAREAGYGEKYCRQAGYRILQRSRVRKLLETKQSEFNIENGLTIESIKHDLREISRNSTSEANRIRALELLGKSLGMFKDETPSLQSIHLFNIVKTPNNIEKESAIDIPSLTNVPLTPVKPLLHPPAQVCEDIKTSPGTPGHTPPPPLINGYTEPDKIAEQKLLNSHVCEEPTEPPVEDTPQ